MTEEESRRLKASIQEVRNVLSALPSPATTDEEDLYEAYKVLHTAAIDPWCTLLAILRARVPQHRDVDVHRESRNVVRASTSDFIV